MVTHNHLEPSFQIRNHISHQTVNAVNRRPICILQRNIVIITHIGGVISL